MQQIADANDVREAAVPAVQFGSQVSEIIASPYADLAGPLPSDIQNFTVLTATIPKSATAPDAAKAFIEFLTSPRADSIYKSKGMEPG
jgi:molybdate transport system substrate-binding protein